METKTYWVGDRPGGSWTFSVLNERTGLPENLVGYTRARVKMLGSDNEEIVIPDENVSISGPQNGEVIFLWPTESVFTKSGRYVLQLELSSATQTRRTSVQEILVRSLGGVSK